MSARNLIAVAALLLVAGGLIVTSGVLVLPVLKWGNP